MPSALGVGLLVAGGLVAAHPDRAAAQAPTVATWTGGSPASDNWSDPANWSPAAAPVDGETLDFPAPSGSVTGYGTDDLTDLSPSSIAIETGPNPASAYLIGSAAGTTISLGAGGFTSSDPGATPDTFPNTLDVPIRLTAGQTWTVTGAGPELDGKITGSSSSLTIDLAATTAGSASAPGSLYLYGDPEVGPLHVAGADSAAKGSLAGSDNGYVVLLAGLNGEDGNPVSVTDAGLFAAGSLGPLSVQGGELFVGSPKLGVFTAAGTYAGSLSARVVGRASFDHASDVVFYGLESSAAPGTTYPQLSSTGAFELGQAQLALEKSCNATFAEGDQLTLVKGAPVVGTFTYQGSSEPIRNGGVVRVLPAESCHGEGATDFQLSYTPSSVTATVVGATGSKGTTASVAPALQVRRKAVRLGSALQLGLDCAAVLPCIGTASVAIGQTVVAKGRFALEAHHRAVATVPLTPAGQRLLGALGGKRRVAIATLILPGDRQSRHPVTI